MQKDIAERLKEFPTLVKLAMLGDVVSAHAVEVFSRDAMLEIEGLRVDSSNLRDALRKVAIVKTYKADGIFVKNQCEICECECGPDQRLTHIGDCPLTILNPSP